MFLIGGGSGAVCRVIEGRGVVIGSFFLIGGGSGAVCLIHTLPNTLLAHRQFFSAHPLAFAMAKESIKRRNRGGFFLLLYDAIWLVMRRVKVTKNLDLTES